MGGRVLNLRNGSSSSAQVLNFDYSACAPHLIFLIGLPGSGKSSLTLNLLHNYPQRRLISTDMIRSRLFGGEELQGPWIKVWLEVRQQFLQAVGEIKLGKALEATYDATNAVRRQRRQALALARASGFVSITGIWLNTPLGLCLERNQRRDRQVPGEVILQMHRRLMGAPPTIEDGFNQLIEIAPSTETLSSEEYKKEILGLTRMSGR